MSMIFLVGMPAAGKTSWGEKIAEKTGYLHYDLDKYIATSEGCGISMIFREKGEAYFREKESNCLSELIRENKKRNVVISCGGGTVVYGNNLKLMKENGCVVYLKAGLDVLAERIKNDSVIRPLLSKDQDIPATLANLYERRKHYYEQADIVINTNEISVAEIEKLVKVCTE